MPHAIGPAAVKIAYHSSFGLHVETLPTREWVTPDVSGFPQGGFARWSDNTVIDADVMIKALTALMAHLYPNTVAFDNYTILTQDNPGDPLLPRTSNGLTDVGDAVSGGWSKAVQTTVTARDEDFDIGKLVFLDVCSFNNFDKVTDLTGLALGDVVDEWTSNGNAWSTRGGKQPLLFLLAATTLNEKLRREYRMQ